MAHFPEVFFNLVYPVRFLQKHLQNGEICIFQTTIIRSDDLATKKNEFDDLGNKTNEFDDLGNKNNEFEDLGNRTKERREWRKRTNGWTE